MIERFHRDFFRSENDFSFIGNGGFGGKANGLIHIKENLHAQINPIEFPGINLFFPKFVVLRTAIFDSFMEENNLREIALSELSNQQIASAFLNSHIPVEYLGDLRTMIEQVKTPLAIRSSSLLEDAKNEPFAGVYATKMIPNNQSTAEERFQKLTDAIKFVYASTYFKESKEYFDVSSHNLEDEKMALMIQMVVGQNHGKRYYPNISGVIKSFNYYPSGSAKPEQGVVNLALGLGKTIVDGNPVWSYSPQFPKSSPPFSDRSSLLKFTQNSFWSVDLNHSLHYDPTKESHFLIESNLTEADYDNTLYHIASTYDSASKKVMIGVGHYGSRILNFAPLLTFNEFNFNNYISKLISTCEMIAETPVEVEFAANILRDTKTLQFAFLQVRPMVISSEIVDVEDSELSGENVVASSKRTMGNGTSELIKDIVFVKPDAFDKKETKKMVTEIEHHNKRLVAEKKPYLLLGFGRWGSSDSWLGIPVEWGQIAGAKAIIESTLFKINVDLSQGSHFFHNMTSFNVFYFSINFDGKYKIDWKWLNEQNVVEENNYTKHVSLENALTIKVDGRSGKGVIRKC